MTVRPAQKPIQAKDVTYIIRAAGERTARLCATSLTAQVPAENVLRVERAPFIEALRECFKEAIEAGREWVLTVDADILLRPSAVDSLLAVTSRLEPHYFTLHSLAFDKFFLGPRPVGHRIYRTSLLKRAMTFLPESAEHLRPEASMVFSMQEQGYPFFECSNLIVGLHDDEQYYRDLYRKFALHARKHSREVQLLKQHWQLRANEDVDFRVALVATEAFEDEKASFELHRDALLERSLHCLESLGLKEKTPLPLEAQIDIEQRMNEQQISPLHKEIYPNFYKN